MSNEVLIKEIPGCDFCGESAMVDGLTAMGVWAFMCDYHFKMYGKGLGLGKGQKLKMVK
jgi:hypothetical protein